MTAYPPPNVPPHMARTMPQRTGSLGCLGVFSVFCLILFTAAEVGVLTRLNPDWLDRRAFWRPKPFERDVLPAVYAGTGSGGLVGGDAVAPPLPSPPPRRLGTWTSDGMRLFGQRAVEADYDPTRGASVTTLEGATLAFPAGAIRERARVRVVPIAEVSDRHLDSRLAVAGPGYKVFVGGQEHYRFSVPITVRLPYDPDLLGPPGTTRGPGVWVYDRGPWEPMQSTFDPATRTVTGRVTHCSGIVCIAQLFGALAPSAGLTFGTATGRGVLNRNILRAFRRDTYDTFNFAIHYTTTGDAAVPADGAFPFRPKERKTGVPDYVVLVGEHLQAIRPKLYDLGVPIADSALRYDVFLEPLDGGVFGESPLGGPMWVTNNWVGEGEQGVTAQEQGDRMRATLAHEMAHVGQDAFFGLRAKYRDEWWIEMTAAYLGDAVWDRIGQPTNVVRNFYVLGENGKLPTVPFDAGGKEHKYAWASFLKWLETKGDVVAVIKRVNSTGEGTVGQFDAALRAVVGRPLGDLLEEFARDYYHGDLYRGHITPPQKAFEGRAAEAARLQTVAPSDFPWLNQHTSRGTPAGGLNVAAEYRLAELPPLTSFAFPVYVDQLPEYSKAKVMFFVPEMPEANGSVTVAGSTVGPALPATGGGGDFSPIPTARVNANPSGLATFTDVHAPGGTDRMTLLVTNRSLTTLLPGVTIRRWVLLRPSWVNSVRFGPRQWSVGWDPTPLYDDAVGKGLLAGYNVYRRRKGDAAFPTTPDYRVRDLDRSLSYLARQLDVPDEEDYVFTVTAVDIYGIESEPAVVEDADPFQGTWSGTVTLVEGSLAAPATQAMRRYVDLLDAREKDAHAKEPDPARRAELQQRWAADKKLLENVRETLQWLLESGETLARLGVPVEFNIRRTDEGYFLRLDRIAWQPTGLTDEAPLERVGRHTLSFRVKEGPPAPNAPATTPADALPPLYIRLHRPNEVRDDYLIDGDVGSRHVRYRLKWTFNRQPQPAGS